MNLSGEKKRKEKEELLNKLLNNPNLSTAFVTSVSIKPVDIPSFIQFREISRRESGARGLSQTWSHAMKEYNIRHGEGNPQLKIATFLDPSAPSPMRVLCWLHLAGATSDGKVYCRTAGAWIQAVRCYGCKNNEMRRST